MAPHQIHISRIYSIGRRRVPHGPCAEPLLRMEAVHVEEWKGN